jgi:flagellar assembly protein FliH
LSSPILRPPVEVRIWDGAPLGPDRSPAERPTSFDQVVDADPDETMALTRAGADQMMQSGGQVAEQALQQARAEADQIRAIALREGYADGQARGLDEWAAERQRARELVAQIGAAYQRFCEKQVPALAELATGAAEKLLQEQLTLEPERVLTIVEQALEHVGASTQISLHLNPDDLPIVSTHPALQSQRQTPRVRLQPDPTVQRGGCWIESDQGEVDATVGGRVARLKAAVASDEVMR